MILKLTEPKTNHPTLGLDSYWVAAYNNIRFKYQRQDVYFVSVTNSSGFARFDMSYIAVTPGISPMVGDVIYVSGNEYDTTCIVTAIDSIIVTGHPSIGIVTDLAFNGSITGFINAISERANWRMEANIKVETITGLKTIANTTYRALPDGTIWVEVQEYIKSYINNNYSYFDSGFTAEDDNSSIGFVIEYRQVFEGYTTEDYTTEDTYYAVNAVMQRTDANAPNLLNYVVFDAHNSAKFLCGFTEPTLWRGYPFNLSYINTANDADLSLVEAWYDINRTQVDSTNQGPVTDVPGKINMLGLNRGIVTSQPYEYMSVALCQSAYPYYLATENKMVRVKTPCAKNEVMLVWRNSLGGWDYYLFNNRHTKELTIDNGAVFEPWAETISGIESQPKTLTKSAYETMQLAAGALDQNDMDGLKGLLKSVAVYSIETSAPYNLTRVIIEPGTWVVSDTKSPLSEIEFTIRKPSLFLQHE